MSGVTSVESGLNLFEATDQQLDKPLSGQDDKLRQYKVLHPLDPTHREWMRSCHTKCTPSGFSLRTLEKEKDTFIVLAEFLLDREIQRKTLPAGDQNRIKNWNISFGSRTFKYFNPTTGNEQSIDLLDIEDEGINVAISQFFEASIWKSECLIKVNNKGDLRGWAPLRRNTRSLLDLPNNFSFLMSKIVPSALFNFLPSQRDTIVRRVLFTYFFHKEFKSKVQFRIEQAKEIFACAKSDLEKKEAAKGVNLLKALLASLDKLDFYALLKSLTVLPIGHVWSEDKIELAMKLKAQVENDIITWTQSFFSSIFEFWKTRELIKEESQYAFDVAGMLFMDRGGYFDFCSKKLQKIKSEGIADVFMREAVAFADGAEVFTAEGFKKSCLFDGFNERLKKDIDKDLSAVAALALEAIPHMSEQDYDPLEKSENAMKRVALAHATRVKWNLSSN